MLILLKEFVRTAVGKRRGRERRGEEEREKADIPIVCCSALRSQLSSFDFQKSRFQPVVVIPRRQPEKEVSEKLYQIS